MAGYGSHLNEMGYTVIPDLVGVAELGAIARFTGGLACDRAGTRRLIELPWSSELAMRLMQDERLSGLLPPEAARIPRQIRKVQSRTHPLTSHDAHHSKTAKPAGAKKAGRAGPGGGSL
jgi:hypothetical protein